MDETKLAHCGPFASALGYITSSAELNKQNRITRGEDIGIDGPLGLYSGVFLLYKGAVMRHEWIKDWKKQIGKTNKYGMLCPAYMPGFNVCTEDLSVALQYSFENDESQDAHRQMPVLFIMSFRNFNKYSGMRLNS